MSWLNLWFILLAFCGAVTWSSHVPSQEAFLEWLTLQRPVLLKEITPDNSWVFLARFSMKMSLYMCLTVHKTAFCTSTFHFIFHVQDFRSFQTTLSYSFGLLATTMLDWCRWGQLMALTHPTCPWISRIGQKHWFFTWWMRRTLCLKSLPITRCHRIPCVYTHFIFNGVWSGFCRTKSWRGHFQ